MWFIVEPLRRSPADSGGGEIVEGVLGRADYGPMLKRLAMAQLLDPEQAAQASGTSR